MNIQKKIYFFLLFGITIDGLNNNENFNAQYAVPVEYNSQLAPLGEVKSLTLNLILDEEKYAGKIIKAIGIIGHLPSLHMRELSEKNQEILYNALMSCDSINASKLKIAINFLVDLLISSIINISSIYVLESHIKNHPSYIKVVEYIKMKLYNDMKQFKEIYSPLSVIEKNYIADIYNNIRIDFIYHIMHKLIVKTFFTNPNIYWNWRNIFVNNIANIILIIGLNMWKIYINIPSNMMLIGWGNMVVNTIICNGRDWISFHNNKKKIQEKFNNTKYINFFYNPNDKTLYVHKENVSSLQMLIVQIMLDK